MRLICPNCGAQYEVADDVIPESGRDVQCSNCGHTWFETPGASVLAEKGEAPADPPVPDTDSQPEPDSESKPQPETEKEPQPEPEPEPAPERRELDPQVADILREEAEYEQAARAAEADPIETQPDLDLSQDPEPDPDEDRRSREARNRLARLRGEPEAAAAAVGAVMAADADAPRRELLPDIEEINSTLRPTEGGQTGETDTERPAQRGGFRRGFMLMVLLALIAVALYVFAPQISAALPQVEPTLTSYVEWVDGLRLWLDSKVQGFIESGAEALGAETATDG